MPGSRKQKLAKQRKNNANSGAGKKVAKKSRQARKIKKKTTLRLQPIADFIPVPSSSVRPPVVEPVKKCKKQTPVQQLAILRVQICAQCREFSTSFNVYVKAFSAEHNQAREIYQSLRHSYRAFKFMHRYQQALRLLNTFRMQLVPELQSTFAALTNQSCSEIHAQTLCRVFHSLLRIVPTLLHSTKQLQLSFLDATSRLKLLHKGLTTGCVAVMASSAALHAHCRQFLHSFIEEWWPMLRLFYKLLSKLEIKGDDDKNSTAALFQKKKNLLDNIYHDNAAELKNLYAELIVGSAEPEPVGPSSSSSALTRMLARYSWM